MFPRTLRIRRHNHRASNLWPTNHVTTISTSREWQSECQHLWQRWRHEYLTSLREFHKSSGSNKESVKVGDVVVMHDDSPRVNWKLAFVTSINRGRDGLVRSVNLSTANGTTNRPIYNKIAPSRSSSQGSTVSHRRRNNYSRNANSCEKTTRRCSTARY